MSEQERSERIDALAEDYLARLRRGESPRTDEYAERHPELRDEIRALFPTLAFVESSTPKTPGEPSFPGLQVLDARRPEMGGMGIVYRARDVGLDRVVAVKTTRGDFDTEEGRAFFEREARAAAQLDHPHIVRVHSFHPDHDPPYYVMQFVDGRPLHRACEGKSHHDVAAMLEKVARALAYAHSAGIVHRDVKPQNILVDHEGEPHVTDFGLAQRAADLLEAAPAGRAAVHGTPQYLAPELWDGTASPSAATDIYALGVTMYVVLTGREPFPGRDLAELRIAVRQATPPMPAQVDPEVPEALQRICMVAMEAEPERRYASARMLADDLRRFLEGREVYARPTRQLRERSGALRHHLAEVGRWHDNRMIDTREMDQLARPYRRILESDSAWDELSRRFPWETALLRLGGWLAVVSSVLWPRFYWEELVRWQRIAALAAPCLLVNLVGWVYLRRRSRLNAVAFLSIGSLLLPLLVLVVLSEYGWLRNPQLDSMELFGAAALDPNATDFVPTNVQVNVAAGAFALYALVLLLVARAKAFAVWVGAGIWASYSAGLLLLGLRHWTDHGQVSRAIVAWIPAALLFFVVGSVLRRRQLTTWAALFYAFFPLPLLLLLTVLARNAGEEWLGATRWDDKPVQLWLMANGLLYLALGWSHARSSSEFSRFWGDVFMLAVPISLLVPANVLFEKGPFLGSAGGQPIGLFEWASVVLSTALVVLGTRVRRAALVAPGVLGLAIAVLRVTERHFAEVLAWPLSLAILGALAMVAGAVMTYMRGKKPDAEAK